MLSEEQVKDILGRTRKIRDLLIEDEHPLVYCTLEKIDDILIRELVKRDVQTLVNSSGSSKTLSK